MLRVLIFSVALLAAMPLTNALAQGRTLEVGDADIVQQASQAVVNLSIWKVRLPRKKGEAPRRVKTYASGFIIDTSGIIITNKHVIDGAIDIMVIFSDGNRAHGTLIAASAIADLAVLKATVANSLPFLKWGDSNRLRVGNPILTIGNPLGIGMSVSAGIISALNRDLQDTPFDSYIQTDAAINKGNSGGPLIDQYGEVVGVNTALYNTDPNGGFIGIGFAIPSAAAQFVVDHLLDPRHPKPGWLGVKLQDVTPALAEALGLPGHKGSLIVEVDQAGPASRAGLRPGDVLERINTMLPSDARDFMRAIVIVPVGEQVTLTVWRDGKEQPVVVTVAAWPDATPEGGVISASLARAMIERPPDLGLKLKPITDAARKQFGLDPKVNGVLVSAVDIDCEAGDLGLVAGDVITMAQGMPVATPADVTHALTVAHEQHRTSAALLVQGKGGKRWVSLSIGGAGE